MINTLTLSDREHQTLLAALEWFKTAKESQVRLKDNSPLCPKDILAPKHSLMHTITVLSKLTGEPLGSYMTPPAAKDKIGE